MSEVLCIDFGYDDNVKREINSLGRKLDKRADDYRRIMKKIDQVGSNTDNLYTANGYLRRKVRSLEDKKTKLDAFKGDIAQFNDDAYDADKRVANRIKESRKAFTKREHIPGVVATAFLVGLKVAAKTAAKIIEVAAKLGILGIIPAVISSWDTIMEFYEANKYWLDVVIDIVILVGAVATIATASGPLLILGTIVGIWKGAKATVDLKYDIMACTEYYINGNEELAKQLNSQGMEYELKNALGENWGGGIYTAMETVSAVYGVCELGRAGIDLVKGNTALARGTDLTLTDGTTKGLAEIKGWRLTHIIKNSTGINIKPGGIISWGMAKNVSNVTKTASYFLNSKPIDGIKSIGIIATLTSFFDNIENIPPFTIIPVPVWCM
mgnify:CR=1 FL=1